VRQALSLSLSLSLLLLLHWLASPVVYFVARVSAESFNVWVAHYLVIITSWVGDFNFFD
jgi:hypothetical protein